ncbi:DUF5667 domain-containing protein [Chloroflexota bacterium]
MEKSSRYYDILNECLDRLLTRGETLEQCLQSYPEQAAELKPLLETALATRQASAIEPRSEFKTQARYQLQAELQAAETKKRPFFWSWWPSWATAVAMALVLMLAGGGTVAAASGSMPDNPLYPVKLASEQVQLALTASPLGRAELQIRLADERVAEIVYLTDKGNVRQIEQTTERLKEHLSGVTVLAWDKRNASAMLTAPQPGTAYQSGQQESAAATDEGSDELHQLLAGYAASNQQRLQAALEGATEQVKSALRQTISVSAAGYAQALQATEE